MKLASAALAILCLLLPVGLVHAQDAAKLDKVTIQLNWLPEPEFGGIYAAQQAGIFAKHGLDVQILKGGPDVPAVQMTAGGKVQFGVAAADEVVAVREKGADLVAIYTTYQNAPQGIMVKKERPVKDIPELLKSGGTLIAQPGLAYLKYFKKHYGMKNVKVIPDDAGGMAQFLDKANTDVAMQCFVFSEPLTAKREGVDPKVFLIADTGFNPYTGVIVTNGEYLKANPAICKRFVAALREGWQAYLDNPEPANDVMAKINSAMDRKTFSEAAAAQKFLIITDETKKHGLGVMTEKRWQVLVDQLLSLGIIDKSVPAAECFANP